MRLRHAFLAFALAAAVQTSAAAQPAFDPTRSIGVSLLDSDSAAPAPPVERYAPSLRPNPVPTPIEAGTRMGADKESYLDVFRILSEENTCSQLFGGPAQAAEVFNVFVRQLQRKPLGDASVAIRMSGDYTNFHNRLSGARYRVFDKAAVNSEGPFYNKVPSQRKSRMTVGRFPVYTRQAKALLLLHELGHMVERGDGAWVLPNDGRDPELSERNTRTVEDHCIVQLRAIED